MIGVQSEMELAFAALQQLCAPLLDLLDDLADTQREALQIAFELSAGAVPDRVFGALVSLLSEAAENQRCCALWTMRSGWTGVRAGAGVGGAQDARRTGRPLFAAREPSDSSPACRS